VINMTELLTPADQFNLTLLHNLEDILNRFTVESYGPFQEKTKDGLSCPFTVGKIYQSVVELYLIKIITNLDYEPSLVAEDVYVPTNSILMFMGVERFYFEKTAHEDSFSIYALKFLFEENVYYDLIPTRFNYDGFDWTDSTQQNVQHIMEKVLKNKLISLENL
jgi:hypothetical protein